MRKKLVGTTLLKNWKNRKHIMVSKRLHRELIITADDFGYSATTNLGIVNSCRSNGGLITQSSLMVSYSDQHAREAVELAQKYDIHLGLHLNLSEGAPISDVSKVASLLTESGIDNKPLFRGKFGLRNSIEARFIKLNELKREIQAQFIKFKELTGDFPKHFDGHHHTHIIPQVCKVVIEALQELKVTGISVRIPAELTVEYPWLSDSQKQFYRGVCEQSVISRALYQDAGMVTTDYFIGMSLMEDLSQRGNDIGANTTNPSHVKINAFRNAIHQIPLCNPVGNDISKEYDNNSKRSDTVIDPHDGNDIVVEMMFHPGLANKDLDQPFGHIIDDWHYSIDRVQEMTLLKDCSNNIHTCDLKAFIESNQFKLTSFVDSAVIKERKHRITIEDKADNYQLNNENNRNSTVSNRKRNSCYTDNKLNIIIASLLTNATGNQVLALGYRKMLVSLGHSVSLVDINTETLKRELLSRLECHIAIGIHAYRSGVFLCDAIFDRITNNEERSSVLRKIKTVVVLGGTDMNLMIHETAKYPIIYKTLKSADAIVSFSETLLYQKSKLACNNNGDDDGGGCALVTLEMKHRCHIIPNSFPNYLLDSIELYDRLYKNKNTYVNDSLGNVGHENGNNHNFCNVHCRPILRDALGIGPKGIDFLGLLPIGIREVKDPFYLIDVFEKWHRSIKESEIPSEVSGNVYMIICGPELDIGLVKQLRQRLNICYSDNNDSINNKIVYDSPVCLVSHLQKKSFAEIGITYLTALPHTQIIMEMLDCDFVCNSSVNEGMSHSLIEAMVLRVPLIVRSNSGNDNLLNLPNKHKKNNNVENDICLDKTRLGWNYNSPEEFVQLVEMLRNNRNCSNDKPDIHCIIEETIQRAQSLMSTEFSKKKEQRKWEHVIKQLL